MRKILLGAGLLALTAGAGFSPSPSKAATAPITFGVPRVVDPIHTYGEPDIKVAPNGDVHVSGPQGTGVQRSVWNVSVDGGDSWRTVQAVPTADQSPAIPDKSDLGPGGGDTEIAIARNGRAYFNDLWALTCFTAATTADRGKTVDSQPAGCSHVPGDREWMALLDPAPTDGSTAPYYLAHKADPGGFTPLNYNVFDNVGVGGDQLDMSTDGLNYTSAGHYADDNSHGVVNGNIVVDQKTGSVIGVTSAPAPKGKHGLAIAVGTPAADGSQTFAYKLVSDQIVGDPENLFPVLAEDAARNLYVVWSTGCDQPAAGQTLADTCFRVYYSYASAADGWAKWSTPVRIDQPPALTNGFPYVAAGGPGLIDVVWYGTSFTDGGKRIHPSDQKNQAWDVYLAQITGADTASPSVNQAKVTPHPMHYNDICLLGTDCITTVGNRNLADFFEVAIDRDGRARVVYPDTSNGLIQPNFPSAIDHPGAPLVTVATQQTGVNAWSGAPLSPVETTAPAAAVSDPVGDAVWKPLGGTTALPGLDLKAVSLSLADNTLHVKVTTEGDSIGDSARAANALFGQLVVRWQMGNTLYYAAVEQSAAGGALTWFAGASSSVDLCSVSACDPHYLTYPAPPAGGTSVTGTTTATHSTVYDIAVPASAVGGVKAASSLEEVMAFSTVSATSASVPLTNAQADADVVPVVVDGTRTFNYSAGSTATFTAGPTASAAGAAAGAAGSSGQLPATGDDQARWLWAAAGLVGLALISARSARTRRGAR